MAGCADDVVAATASPVDPAIMPAAISAISTGLATRVFSRAVRAGWIGTAGSYRLIGVLPLLLAGCWY
jgi:hypothetical protein